MTTRAERAAADKTARAQMKASMEQCEQAREQMGRVGSMRAPTPGMVENMKQCQASEVHGIKPTGIHFYSPAGILSYTLSLIYPVIIYIFKVKFVA